MRGKIRSHISIFFSTLLVFTAGHMFFTFALITEAYAFEQTPTVHYDVMPHGDEDEHLSCSAEVLQFSQSRSSDISSDIHNPVFNSPQADLSDLIISPEIFSSVTYDEGIPSRLPFAQKTQLRI